MLAACKPLILLDFHRSFNDTSTILSVRNEFESYGHSIFYVALALASVTEQEKPTLKQHKEKKTRLLP